MPNAPVHCFLLLISCALQLVSLIFPQVSYLGLPQCLEDISKSERIALQPQSMLNVARAEMIDWRIKLREIPFSLELVSNAGY